MMGFPFVWVLKPVLGADYAFLMLSLDFIRRLFNGKLVYIVIFQNPRITCIWLKLQSVDKFVIHLAAFFANPEKLRDWETDNTSSISVFL